MMSICHKIILYRCMKHMDLKDAAAAGPARTRHLLHSPNSFNKRSTGHSKLNNFIQNNCTKTTQDPTSLLRSGHKQEAPLAGQTMEDSVLASSAGPLAFSSCLFLVQQVTSEGILVYSVIRPTFLFEMFSSGWSRFTFISMGSSASSTVRNKGLKSAKSSLTSVRWRYKASEKALFIGNKIHGIPGWIRLEGALKLISFHPCHGQGHLPDCFKHQLLSPHSIAVSARLYELVFILRWVLG